MKTTNLSKGIIGIAMTIIMITGCSSTQQVYKGNPQDGLYISYCLNEGDNLKYKYIFKNSQVMEAMGQTMETTITTQALYTLIGQNIENTDEFTGKIVVNDLSMDIVGPQGNSNPDLSKLIGKPFTLSSTPWGVEKMIDTDSLSIDLGPMNGGQQNISDILHNILPNLPEEAITLGQNWTKLDTTVIEKQGMNITTIIEKLYKFDGFETINNQSCVKITSAGTGTIDGSGKQGDMDITVEGDLESELCFYIDFAKGHLVKSDINTITETTLIMTGSQNLIMPMTVETNASICLIK
ncbi:hypothetical protein KAR48_07205 [bacterium]|nr:hypothetical protein [bacterium]